MTRVSLTFLLLVATFAAPPAFAGEVERAEHIRVSEEMRKLAGRNAWSAVDAQYRKLEELERKGEKLEAKEHLLGAQAGRSLGDVTAARARYAKAQAAGDTTEAATAIAEIDANFGRVELTFEPKWEGDRTLAAKVPPFAPDQRAALAIAVQRVADGADYIGLLPAGDYTIAGKAFNVVVGQAAVAKLRVERDPNAPKEPFKLAFVGPRAELGVAITSGGAVGESGASEEAGVQATSFGGAGARLGVGVEVGLTETVGVIAQVGYHNLFGAAAYDGEPLASTDSYVVSGNSLHMGYGWLAADFRLGDLWLAVGPVWGVGSATVTGIDGYCATPGNCDDITGATEDATRYQRLTGNILAGGAALSASYALVEMGSLSGAVTLEGGAQTDSYRWYPWGQLAFTVAPSGPAKEK